MHRPVDTYIDTYIDVPNSVISGNEPSSEML